MTDTTIETPDDPDEGQTHGKPWDKPVHDSPPVSSEPNPVRTTEYGDVEDADPDSEPEPEPDQGDYPKAEEGAPDTQAPRGNA